MSTNVTDRFVNEILELCSAQFSPQVIHQAKRCLMDYIGSTLAGAHLQRDKIERLLASMCDEAGVSSVIGFDRKASVENAAFINGLSSHIAELDDGVISGIVHPGAPVLSALLPVAQKEAVPGDSLLKGIVVGYEVATRLSDAIQPAHKKHGYHATGTCGSIGAAMGVAAMLDFNRDQMKDVFSSAVVAAVGTLKVLEDDSELKPYNVAQAAIHAVLAVSMGRAGFVGPNDVLSGDTGFVSMVAGEMDESALFEKANGLYAVERVYVKPYAACRYCHPAIDAVLKMREEHSLQAGQVESIRVATYLLAVAKHDHTQIKGVSSAKMSIPYSVAVALVAGRAGMEEYTERYIADPAVAGMAKKVSVRADDELTNLFPEYSAAIVDIHMTDGSCLSARVDLPKGEASAPLADQEMENKCVSLAAYAGKSSAVGDDLVKTVWNVESDLANLFRLV